MHPISDAFASVLRAGRADFNARFAQTRHRSPGLSAEAFADFLATGVDPVVRAVAALAPDRAAETAGAGYEIGLELVSRNLAGPGAKHAAMAQAWRDLLPAAAGLVAAAPRRVLGAVANAVCQLAATPGARPAWWLDEMARLVPRVPVGSDGVEHFLRLGQVAAWRAGMAHFRSGALATLDTLPEPLARAALGVPDTAGDSSGAAAASWRLLRARLDADPWHNPARTEEVGRPPVRFAGRAGEFRGFGGLFPVPPRVAGGGDGQFFVQSGTGHWLLVADVFGATFHRATPEEFAQAASRPAPRPGGPRPDSVPLPFCGEITSHAANASTLAVTGSLTHAVLLVALGLSSPPPAAA